MTSKPRVGLAVIRHPLEEGGEQAPRILQDIGRALRAAGLDVIEAPSFIEDRGTAVATGRRFYDERVPAIVLAAATWSADPNLLDLLEECSVPVLTWALPGMSTGSMCGCQQFGYLLRELGRPHRFVFGEPSDRGAVTRVLEFAAAAHLVALLRRSRFGLVGYRINGMTEVAFDEVELKRVLGPRTIHYGLEQIEDAMAQVSRDEAMAVWEERLGCVGKVSVAQEDIVDSMRGYVALRRLADRDDLSGLAVECYPDYMGRLCLAGSLLADEGVVVGCEADMNSTVAMFILSSLTGGPVHNTDPLGVDLEAGWVVYSHCGNGSLRLAETPEKVEIGRVRLMHQGCVALFPGRPGPVTLVNLCGRRGTYRMGMAFGEAVPTEMVFAGNPTKVVIEGGVRRHLDLIAREALGHHWMIGYGDARGALRELCDLTGVRCVE